LIPQKWRNRLERGRLPQLALPTEGTAKLGMNKTTMKITLLFVGTGLGVHDDGVLITM
jgi:hypothetical protein